uniref:RRM domain-containing protein n=1 Tax=viral metagenome TaxID=1070528 RepID=A0A6C0C8P3_9ZZZZ
MSNNQSPGSRMMNNKKNYVTYASTVAGNNSYHPRSENSPPRQNTAAPVQEESQVFQDAPVEYKRKYEAVFFAKYGFNDMQPRPALDDITKLFSNYGVIDHITYPENKQFAIIFMTSLVTKAVHQKTNAVIGDIINDMTMENRFHVSIANSNRNKKPQYSSNNPPKILKNPAQPRPQNDGSFTNPQFRARRNQQSTN